MTRPMLPEEKALREAIEFYTVPRYSKPITRLIPALIRAVWEEKEAMIPNLTPAELERLALLMEEMGEAHQAIGKIMRHGYESRHPDGGPTNRELLEKEIGDVEAAITMLCNSDDLSVDTIGGYELKKLVSVKRYLHHQVPTP